MRATKGEADSDANDEKAEKIRMDNNAPSGGPNISI